LSLLQLARGEFRSTGSLDWTRLLAEAEGHGMTPLLAASVLESNPGEVPDSIRMELAKALQFSAARNLKLSAALHRILDILSAEGIRAIPFKGRALAAALYGNLALRPSTDLDLLVRRPEAVRATQALVEVGYTTDLPADKAVQAAYLRSRHEIHLGG